MFRELAFLVVGCLLCLATAQECGECRRSDCPELDRSKCLAGVARDNCKCCQVCAQLEGEACDLKGAPPNFGKCGDHLQCQNRSDAVYAGYCACRYHEVLCGTDGKTYENFCQLSQRNKELGGDSLKVKTIGKCLMSPAIVSNPQNVKNLTLGNIAMNCEASGYPIPYMVWQFTDAGGKVHNLPGDDFKVSMYVRGGPEPSQITGWLQINGITKKHEGDYKCIASNSEGKAEGVGRLLVMDDIIDAQEQGENDTF